MTIDQLLTWLSPIKRCLVAMISRALIRRVDDTTPLQSLQLALLDDELRDRVDRVQHYGFTTHPPVNAECVVLFPNGERDEGIVIAVDDRRYRIKPLAAGEIALYTDEGDRLHFQRGHQITLETHTLTIRAKDKVHMDTPELTVTGDIKDQSNGSGMTMQAMRKQFDQHKHTGDSGGMTGPPTS